MAGYSGTPLPKKLGIKAAHRVALVAAPVDLQQALADAAPEAAIVHSLAGRNVFDVILLFACDRAALMDAVPKARARLSTAGGLWLAWPKKASGVATDLSDGAVREIGLAADLVDNKVCAIDDTWSGLRFVRRLADR